MWEFETRSAVFYTNYMVELQHLKQFDDRPVRTLFAGEQNNSWITLQNGEAYAFGDTEDGKLGRDMMVTFLDPSNACRVTVNPPTRFIDAQLVRKFAILLSDGGILYSCGLLPSGSILYNPTSMLDWADPSSFATVKQIAVGREHCFIVSNEGKVFALGSQKLCRVTDRTKISPIPSLSSIKVKQVATGNDHHLVLSDDGTVYIGGSARVFNLVSSETLYKVQGLDGVPIKFVAAGCGEHCLAISDTGAVYTWGDGALGKLGHGNTQDQQDPVLVKTLIGAGASYAALGGDTTFIVDVTGKLFGCGLLPFMLPRHSREDYFSPTLIDCVPPSARVVAVAAGDNHCLFALERGMASLVALCIWTIRKHKLYRPNDPQCIKLPAELEQYLL